ncbi:MAG: hypothetical protein PWR03_869 [Tenuifilum sp.]|uniref:hypothetical protein n=1 Tax=Tenuifilum sp. TaxID=2760880 RepID=UPI0024AA9B67|nr:hypothetical protein [Tenuifilum sp.]MDI3526686.1 hypothetical protein [Tenuifilum sp.]
MTVRIINIFTYLAIVALMFSIFKFYNHIYIIKSIVFVLILIFSFGVLVSMFKRDNDNIEVNIFEKASLFVFALISCFTSSIIIGIQYHDIYNGNPLSSFGTPINLIVLALIYPLLFSMLFFCISVFNKWILDFIALIVWEIISVYTAYFYDYKIKSGSTCADCSDYFPSDTKLITPLIQILVGIFIILLLLKNKFVYQRVQNIYKNIITWVDSKILK